ncbi:MAG: VOC family protein [Ilumatobacteraceae bacterium]|jgi:2-polyprenyl-6-hydroxyphenyl methylase/3-demethylubiquinone-9 3-methyltransferase
MAATSLTTYLWFDDQALEAATFYVGLFPGSRLGEVSHYRADAQRPAGSVLTVEFELFGRPFAALNGGPQFPHSEAVSFQVACDGQEDVDRLWHALIADGGSESRCGWCRDRWGVSWQIIPTALGRALRGLDGYDADYAFRAMMGMSRIIVADLRAAE